MSENTQNILIGPDGSFMEFEDYIRLGGKPYDDKYYHELAMVCRDLVISLADPRTWPIIPLELRQCIPGILENDNSLEVQAAIKKLIALLY